MAETGISFFIPAYNCAATIEEAVNSIIETNFKTGDEIIIVNDSSADHTAQILSLLQTKYPYLKVISHKYNKGGAAARNTAVEIADNELLFCLDADNVLASIEALKDYLIKMNADVASFQHQHFFTNDKFNPDYIWTLPAGMFDISNYYTGKNTLEPLLRL